MSSATRAWIAAVSIAVVVVLRDHGFCRADGTKSEDHCEPYEVILPGQKAFMSILYSSFKETERRESKEISIRSVVCLNLPSFSGGLNPWGTPNSRKKRDRELTPPYVDDGLLEVVGFRDAWLGLVLLAPNGHRIRPAGVKVGN